MKFNKLANMMEESSQYKLNKKGEELILWYHNLVFDLEKAMQNVFNRCCVDFPESVKKTIALQTITIINSHQLGTRLFKIASRLDVATSGGKQPIDANKFVFNDDDKIKEYIEKIS